MKVLAVLSGKGGVGKTFVCVNLSVWLAKQGYRVLLVDSDVALADTYLMLGVRPNPVLSLYFSGKAKLEQALAQTSYGVDLLSAGPSVVDPMAISRSRREKFIREMHHISSSYDLVVVDTPAGFSDYIKSIAEASHHVFYIITPEVTSLSDVHRLSNALGVGGNLVVNKAEKLAHGIRVFDRMLGALNPAVKDSTELAGIILKDDARVNKSIESGIPAVVMFPKSHIRGSFDYIGEFVLSKLEVPVSPKKDLWEVLS